MRLFSCFKATLNSAGKTCSRQRGDMLTEAMISMLLFAVAGVGVTSITSEVASSQRNFKVQQQVVNELRSMVQNRADSTILCDGASMETENFTTDIQVQGCAATTATVGGKSISGVYAPVVLTATIEGIGDVRVGGVSAN